MLQRYQFKAACLGSQPPGLTTAQTHSAPRAFFTFSPRWKQNKLTDCQERWHSCSTLSGSCATASPLLCPRSSRGKSPPCQYPVIKLTFHARVQRPAPLPVRLPVVFQHPGEWTIMKKRHLYIKLFVSLQHFPPLYTVYISYFYISRVWCAFIVESSAHK